MKYLNECLCLIVPDSPFRLVCFSNARRLKEQEKFFVFPSLMMMLFVCSYFLATITKFMKRAGNAERSGRLSFPKRCPLVLVFVCCCHGTRGVFRNCATSSGRYYYYCRFPWGWKWKFEFRLLAAARQVIDSNAAQSGGE
jgi:hypothetical protein